MIAIASEELAAIDTGRAPVIVPQTDSLQVVAADDDIAVITSNANAPLALDKTDLAVTTLETTTVL